MHNLIIVIGVILIAVGTILTYWGKDLKNKETNRQLQKSISSKNGQIDELVEGKNVVIKQNEELNKKIGDYQKELEEKQKEINELEKFAKKDIYKPLSAKLKSRLSQNIKIAKKRNITKVLIELLDSNNNGKRLLGDLIKLLNESGIESAISGTGISFGSGVYHHKVKTNKNTVESAQYLCDILSMYLKIKYNSVIDNNLEGGVIHIELHGIPLFHEDGSVEFQ